MGIQAFPSLADQALRPELRVVRRSDSIVALNVVDVCADDPQRIYYEDKLGCARGVVFALAFQAAVVVIAAVCWKLFVR